MTTPITEMSLTDLLAAAQYGEEESAVWTAQVEEVNGSRYVLVREVALAQDRASRAETRTAVSPAHWRDAQGELTRLRRELWETEGEILMLRAELERRVRRVRTGGTT